jgi:hypothetical protein
MKSWLFHYIHPLNVEGQEDYAEEGQEELEGERDRGRWGYDQFAEQ